VDAVDHAAPFERDTEKFKRCHYSGKIVIKTNKQKQGNNKKSERKEAQRKTCKQRQERESARHTTLQRSQFFCPLLQLFFPRFNTFPSIFTSLVVKESLVPGYPEVQK